MNHPSNTPQPDELLVTAALRTLAADIAALHTPPPAAPILLRAERERRRLALARAIRPLRIMQRIAVAAPIPIAALMLRQSRLFEHQPSTLITPSILEFFALGILLVIGGCYTMLRAARQPT
jgi:hypothetical protein